MYVLNIYRIYSESLIECFVVEINLLINLKCIHDKTDFGMWRHVVVIEQSFPVHANQVDRVGHGHLLSISPTESHPKKKIGDHFLFYLKFETSTREPRLRNVEQRDFG